MRLVGQSLGLGPEGGGGGMAGGGRALVAVPGVSRRTLPVLLLRAQQRLEEGVGSGVGAVPGNALRLRHHEPHEEERAGADGTVRTEDLWGGREGWYGTPA